MSTFDQLKENAFGRIRVEELTPQLLEDVKVATSEEISNETSYTNSTPTINGIGGVEAGETFDNVPLKDMITKILYPYVKPGLSVSTTPNNGGVFEKGSVKSGQKIQANVSKKSQSITEVKFLEGSAVLKTLSGSEVANGGTFYSDVLDDISTNKLFRVEIKDGKSTVGANTGQFTFVHPIYYGVLSAETSDPTQEQIKGLTKKVVNVSSQTIGFTASNERMVIAVPSNWTLKTAFDPNKFDMTSSFGLVRTNVECLDGSQESYKVYMSSPTTQTGFNVTFNF